MTLTDGGSAARVHDGRESREILDHVADKWSLAVVACLAGDELRFTELRRRVAGISARMLSITLRTLERDGIVIRTVHSRRRPNVAYRLTPLGTTLPSVSVPLIDWAIEHVEQVDAARHRYDMLRTTAAPLGPDRATQGA